MSIRKTTGISYTEVCARQTSLEAVQEIDAQWLNSLSQGQDAMEWNGFNNELARSQGILKPASHYMFGPLIDAPPSHPDAIITLEMHLRSQEWFPFSEQSSKDFQHSLASVEENIEAYEILHDRIEEIADKTALEADQANIDEQHRTNNITKESYLDMIHALDTWKIGRLLKKKADDLSESKHLTSSRVLKGLSGPLL